MTWKLYPDSASQRFKAIASRLHLRGSYKLKFLRQVHCGNIVDIVAGSTVQMIMRIVQNIYTPLAKSQSEMKLQTQSDVVFSAVARPSSIRSLRSLLFWSFSYEFHEMLSGAGRPADINYIVA